MAHFHKPCGGSFQGYFPLFVLGMALLLANACERKSNAGTAMENAGQAAMQSIPAEPPLAKIPVTRVIEIANFFQFLDKVVQQNDTLDAYPLSEHLLLRANPWILDTLVRTDYYFQKSLGNFIYDQTRMPVLKPGDTLLLPGPKTAGALLDKMANTWIDINIPAFELRILERDSVLFRMPVRVGKNQKKRLELAGHQVDLRTRTGTGEIIRVNRNPLFIDPVTGKKFKFTKRDDHQTTLMPQIPWLEPSINGQRYGQMIHPTTNPRSLGKPASNGCIGVCEADAWRIYFFAPLGTKVTIRYELQGLSPAGDTIYYQDIYQLRKSKKSGRTIAVAGLWSEKTAGICLCDSLF